MIMKISLCLSKLQCVVVDSFLRHGIVIICINLCYISTLSAVVICLLADESLIMLVFELY